MIPMTYEIHYVDYMARELFVYTDDVDAYLYRHDLRESECIDIRLVRYHEDLADFQVKRVNGQYINVPLGDEMKID
jgi:hypothetical protein